MVEQEKKRYFLAQDLEAVSHNNINGIGIYVGDSEGSKILKGSWWIDTDESALTPECKREFYDKNPEIWKRYEENKKPEADQIKDYVKTYDSVAELIGVEEVEIELLSDNPEFDFGRLSEYVKKHCGREPLRYTKKRYPRKNEKGEELEQKEGNYRCITDIGDTLWFLEVGSIVKDHIDTIQVHDHDPSNDAEAIYLTHLVGERFIKKVKEELGEKLKEIARTVSSEFVENIKKRKREEIVPRVTI